MPRFATGSRRIARAGRVVSTASWRGASLLELGLSAGPDEGSCDRGSLHLVHRGVYAVGHRVIRAGRWMAAVLACGAECGAEPSLGGRAWGSCLVRRDRCRSDASCGLAGAAVGHRAAPCAALPATRSRRSTGIPVTAVSRTLLDLAAMPRRGTAGRAMNEAEVRRLTDRVSVHALWSVIRAGGEQRPCAPCSDAPEGSWRDAAASSSAGSLRRCRRPIFPAPHRNADVAVAGRFFEVDCLWRAQRLIVELDGRFVHGTWRASERDRERDRSAVADGWRVVRVTWRQLRDDAPAP